MTSTRSPAPGDGTAAHPDSLRRAVLAAPADAAADTIASWVAARCGTRAQVRLVDRAGCFLRPVASSDDAAVDVWPLDDGPAAEAFWTRTVRREDGPTGRVHVPMAVRGIAHGVLTVEGARPDAEWAEVGQLAALLLDQAGQVTDAWEIACRSAAFSVSAEFQWQQLPATSVTTPRAELHALVEPAPRVSSDLYDWSFEGDRLWLAVLDAEGRSLSAALPAALAVAALRHARRAAVPLHEQVALADQAVYDHFRGAAVVRALVLDVNLAEGSGEVVRAGGDDGAPLAFRRRGGHVTALSFGAQDELGRFDRSRYVSEHLDLRTGDDLLVASDGSAGARDGGGAAFGVAAVAERFAAGQPLAAVPRRLLDALRTHRGGDLEEDATAVVVGVRG